MEDLREGRFEEELEDLEGEKNTALKRRKQLAMVSLTVI